MTAQPGYRPQPATPAGQPADIDQQRIDRIADAFNQALEEAAAPPTAYKDTAPVPAIGTTPPVPQPGRPAMSQKAVDLNTTLISISVVIGMTGAAATGVLVASGHANPTVIAWVCACVVAVPAALAIPILALKGLMKSAKEVAEATPPEIHQHYSGHVHQDHRSVHVHTTTRGGIVAVTRNQLPELPPGH